MKIIQIILSWLSLFGKRESDEKYQMPRLKIFFFSGKTVICMPSLIFSNMHMHGP